MMEIVRPELDEQDRAILMQMQSAFPLRSHPYAVIAERLGLTEQEVVERAQRLKAEGIIRRIGAVLEAAKTGYVTTLVAVEVEADELDRAVKLINSYPETTHNYLREGTWNVWFALVAASQARIEGILKEITEYGGWRIMNLPVVRRYKVRAEFEL